MRQNIAHALMFSGLISSVLIAGPAMASADQQREPVSQKSAERAQLQNRPQNELQNERPGHATDEAAALPAAKGAEIDLSRDYYREGEQLLAKQLATPKYEGKAKNLIIFIGDGMGISTLTAGRIYQGQQAGRAGEETVTAMDSLPQSALVKTYSHDYQVSDSASTATAIMSGVKTRSGMLGLSHIAQTGQCEGASAAIAASLFELAEDQGRATGIISTARITHATPAAAYAHSPSRNWESDGDLPADAQGCNDIARQLVEWDHGDGFEVVLGGGRSNFLPKNMADPEYGDKTGKRDDGRDLIAEWQQRTGGQYAWNKAQFAALNPDATTPVFGLFEPSHMQYELDRIEVNSEEKSEPSLAEMTEFAIRKLAKNDANDKGYILLVEAGRIDHAHHGGNAARALGDMHAMDQAIAKALSLVDLRDTLILATADHSHVFTLAGYPQRGNGVFDVVHNGDGEVAKASDGKAYTSLGYHNGPGAIVGERPDPAQQDVTAMDYQQQALIPSGSETHGGEDVALKAAGAGAHHLHGTIEQHLIFHLARYITGL